MPEAELPGGGLGCAAKAAAESVSAVNTVTTPRVFFIVLTSGFCPVPSSIGYTLVQCRARNPAYNHKMYITDFARKTRNPRAGLLELRGALNASDARRPQSRPASVRL